MGPDAPHPRCLGQEPSGAFVTDAIKPGTEVYTDGWHGYDRLQANGYRHRVTRLRGDTELAVAPLPRVHRVVSLLKRWLWGTDDGQALVTLYQRSRGEYLPLPYPDYLAFRDTLEDEVDLAAFCRTFAAVSDGAFPTVHQGELVSGTFFSVLRTQPHLGRVIDRSDNVTPGGHPVVVLSHMLWQTVFGGDPHVVGRPIRLNGLPYEVVGVTPPGSPK